MSLLRQTLLGSEKCNELHTVRVIKKKEKKFSFVLRPLHSWPNPSIAWDVFFFRTTRETRRRVVCTAKRETNIERGAAPARRVRRCAYASFERHSFNTGSCRNKTVENVVAIGTVWDRSNIRVGKVCVWKTRTFTGHRVRLRNRNRFPVSF